MMQACRPLHAASAAPDHCSLAWHSLLCPQVLRLHSCILRYCLASCVSTRPRNSLFPFPASQPPSVGPLVVEVSMQLGGTEEGLRWGHSTREGDNMLGVSDACKYALVSVTEEWTIFQPVRRV